PAHRVEAARELGGKQGLVIAERQILSSDYTRAVAEVQNWTARIYFQTEEALNYRSARETNIAVFGGLFCGRRRRCVNERRPPLGEGRQMAPRTHGDGANAQRNQPHRLMAWGVSASAFPQPNLEGERRRVNTQNSQSNSGSYYFFFAVASPPSSWKRIQFQKVK
ncbi:putative trans-sialidase, partial [Trypanosoma cruzi]